MSTSKYSLVYLLPVFLLCFVSCMRDKGIDPSTMHVYSADELTKIINNAARIELVGAPSESRIQHDSSITVTRTQIYKVFVQLDDKGQLVENPDTSAVAALKATGPIIITTSCNMTCTRVKPDEPCNISGCMETKRCGCSQGSCGNNCTTDVACHTSRSGFGFGNLIIF